MIHPKTRLCPKKSTFSPRKPQKAKAKNHLLPLVPQKAKALLGLLGEVPPAGLHFIVRSLEAGIGQDPSALSAAHLLDRHLPWRRGTDRLHRWGWGLVEPPKPGGFGSPKETETGW